MKKRGIALLLTFAMLASAFASAMAETTLFTDDLGRSVEIPAEISRIVPSGPMTQIMLLALAPDLFVGLGDQFPASAEGIIDDTLFSLPYFGRLYGSAELSVESLALAEPQLIIDIGEPKNDSAENLDALEMQTSIPAVFLGATLETMPDTYRRLGELLGRQQRAEELAAFLENTYARTVSIIEQVGENKVDSLYVLGEEGLNVLAKGSYHAELIDMLTNNLAVVGNPLSKGTGNEVSMEQLMLWDPEFILFAPQSIYKTAAADPSWSLMTAIANGRFVEVPEGPYNFMGMPPSVQRYLGMIWLTAVLYPAYCDYDVKAEILEFYRLFYGCNLTDAQYDALTANAFLNE